MLEPASLPQYFFTVTKDQAALPVNEDSESTPPTGSIPRSHRRRRLGARREAAKHETREALITAAMAAFAEDGLDNPSLDAICARAGYTRGAFYVHFRDREDLIAAVSERFLGRLVAVVGEGSESDSLTTLVTKLIGVVRESGPVPAHQFLHACGRSDTMRQRYLEALGKVATRLQEAATGPHSGQDAEHLPWLVLATATGLQSLIEAQAPVDAVKLGEVFTRMLSALAAESSAAPLAG